MGAVQLFFNILLLATVVIAVTTSFTCNRTWLSSTREHNLRRSKTHEFYQGTSPGHVLVGHDYRIAMARSYVTCAVLCLVDEACKSFNYCMDGKLCQLNSAVYSRNTTTLQKSSSCIYFDESFHKGNRFPMADEKPSASASGTENPTQTTMTQSPIFETYAPPLVTTTLVTTTRVAVESSASLCPQMYTTQSGLKLTSQLLDVPFVFEFTLTSGRQVKVELTTMNNVYTLEIKASSIKLFRGGSSSSGSLNAVGNQMRLEFGTRAITVNAVGSELTLWTSGQEVSCTLTLMSTEEATWTIDSCDVKFS